VAAVYTAVGRQFGSCLVQEDVGQRFREAFAEDESLAIAQSLTSEEIERDRWRRIVRSVLHDVHDPDACFAELFTHFARPDSWRLFTDVPEALAKLRSARIRLGVASNFDARLFGILEAVDCTRGIEFVLASSMIGWRKPHAGFFDAIVSRAQADRKSILYVGDDPVNDVAAAVGAGLNARLIDRRSTRSGAMQSLGDLCLGSSAFMTSCDMSGR
jgi:putative hydrolase of the HAD superfamily